MDTTGICDVLTIPLWADLPLHAYRTLANHSAYVVVPAIRCKSRMLDVSERLLYF